MQEAPKTDTSFAMRRDTAGLLIDFVEWQALRGALEGLPTRLIPDIPCPPEDVLPDDHGAIVHLDLAGGVQL